MQVVTAELIHLDGELQRGCCVVLDRRSGRILFAGPTAGAVPFRLAGAESLDLGRVALLPGMVNCHSHAFQIGLRGRGEAGYAPEADEAGGLLAVDADDFWTWRAEMYKLVAGMDCARMRALTEAAFREMLRGGITSVGEFHYFHHAGGGGGGGGGGSGDGGGGARDHEFDRVVVEAAREVGIRLVLLSAFYCRGGIAPTAAAAASAEVPPPLTAAQQRFSTPTVPHYFDALDRIRAEFIDDSDSDSSSHSRLLTLGVVAHSVRAASAAEIEELGAGALARGLPMHMHLEEQPKEIADCRAATGRTPLQLVMPTAARLGGRFTAVHCTHSSAADLDALVGHGANVCVCPLTEGCLGDGLPRLESCGPHLCLGSDCNARVCLAEEMRWLEYGQRLKHCRRGMVVAPRQGRSDAAQELFRCATTSGARSLGIDAGAIERGRLADLFTIDLDAPALAPVRAAAAGGGGGGGGDLAGVLLPAFVFGCAASEVVRDVCVGGRWRVRAGAVVVLATAAAHEARPPANNGTRAGLAEAQALGRRCACTAVVAFGAASLLAAACR